MLRALAAHCCEPSLYLQRRVPHNACRTDLSSVNKLHLSSLFMVGRGHSTVSRQGNTRAGGLSWWKDDAQCYGSLSNLWPKISVVFSTRPAESSFTHEKTKSQETRRWIH